MGVYGFLPGEVHVRVWRLFLQGGSFGIRTLHSRLCTIIVALLSTNKSDHICAYAPVINQSTPILQVGVRSWPRAQGCKKGIVSEGLRLDSSSSSHQRNQNQTCFRIGCILGDRALRCREGIRTTRDSGRGSLLWSSCCAF